MWPIFKKELRENWAYAAAVFLGVLLLLEISCKDQGWDPLNVFDATTVPVWRSPLFSPLPIQMWGTICVWLAALIAIKVVYEEQWRRTWPVLAQLPVSRERIVFAKFLSGLTIYSAITIVSAVLLVLDLFRAGAWPGPFMLGDCWALAFAWIGGLCVYCLTFLCAQRHARWYVTKWLPLVSALLAWFLPIRVAGLYLQIHSLGRVLEYGRLDSPLLTFSAIGLLLATVLAVLGIRSQARTREY